MPSRSSKSHSEVASRTRRVADPGSAAGSKSEHDIGKRPGTARAPVARQKAATLKDVASAAQVSIATVSKFVNGGQRFTPEVEARITEAIKALSYRPNPMAQGMITGRTGNLGIVILDIRNPYFTSLVKGASKIAGNAGLNLLFADAAESRTADLAVLRALSPRVDGLIVSARLPDPVIDWLQQTGIPAVFYGGPPPRPGLRTVGCDNHAAAFALGRHLRERGHSTIGYVGFSAARWSEARWLGLRDAFEGVDCSFQRFDVAAPSAEEGERIASSVLLQSDPPDAVVAYNDLVALGLLSQARSFGIRVPEQISIAGFDNIAYGRYVTPALTSVDTAAEMTGEVAMSDLIAMIADGGHDVPEHHVLPSRVIARESTMRPEAVVGRRPRRLRTG